MSDKLDLEPEKETSWDSLWRYSATYISSWFPSLDLLLWGILDYIVDLQDWVSTPQFKKNLRIGFTVTLIGIPVVLVLFTNYHADNPVCSISGWSDYIWFCKLPPLSWVSHTSATNVSDPFRDYLPVVEREQSSHCLSEEPLKAYLRLSDARASLLNAYPPPEDQLRWAISDIEWQSTSELNVIKRFYCGTYEHLDWVLARIYTSAQELEFLGNPSHQTQQQRFMRFWSYEIHYLACKISNFCLNTNTTSIINFLTEYKAKALELQELGEKAILKAEDARERIIEVDHFVRGILEEPLRQGFISKIFPQFDGHEPYRNIQKSLEVLEKFWGDTISVEIYPQLQVLKLVQQRVTSTLWRLSWGHSTLQPGDLMERELYDLAYRIRKDLRKFAASERQGIWKFVHQTLTYFMPERFGEFSH